MLIPISRPWKSPEEMCRSCVYLLLSDSIFRICTISEDEPDNPLTKNENMDCIDFEKGKPTIW